jgi:hypothetical protein
MLPKTTGGADETIAIFIMALLLIILAQFWYDVIIRGYEDLIGHKAKFWQLLIVAIILTILFFIGLKYATKISLRDVI